MNHDNQVTTPSEAAAAFTANCAVVVIRDLERRLDSLREDFYISALNGPEGAQRCESLLNSLEQGLVNALNSVLRLRQITT